MRFRHLLPLAALLLATACGGPKDTPLPKELDKLESIKPAMEKLTEDEKKLASGYIMRHTLGAKMAGLFGGKEGPGIPDGMTLGKAIDDQRKFLADIAADEAKQKAVKDKLVAEREAATKPLREAVTVTLVAKSVKPEYGGSGMLLDEHLAITFGYKNNTTKDIAGVKGTIDVKDLFGDRISVFGVSNDTTIKAGDIAKWSGSRSVKYPRGGNNDRKLAELSDDKYKVIWEPEVIIFTDGTRLAVPEN